MKACEKCIHDEVCIYKEGYSQLYDAIYKVVIDMTFPAAKECIIGDIIVPCKIYYSKVTAPRSKFTSMSDYDVNESPY